MTIQLTTTLQTMKEVFDRKFFYCFFSFQYNVDSALFNPTNFELSIRYVSTVLVCMVIALLFAYMYFSLISHNQRMFLFQCRLEIIHIHHIDHNGIL